VSPARRLCYLSGRLTSVPWSHSSPFDLLPVGRPRLQGRDCPLSLTGLHPGLSHPSGAGTGSDLRPCWGGTGLPPLYCGCPRDFYLAGSPPVFFCAVAQWLRDLGNGNRVPGLGTWGMAIECLPGSLQDREAALGPLANLSIHRVSWPWPWLLQGSRMRCDLGWLRGTGAPAGPAFFGLGCPPSSPTVGPRPPGPAGTWA